MLISSLILKLIKLFSTRSKPPLEPEIILPPNSIVLQIEALLIEHDNWTVSRLDPFYDRQFYVDHKSLPLRIFFEKQLIKTSYKDIRIFNNKAHTKLSNNSILFLSVDEINKLYKLMTKFVDLDKQIRLNKKLEEDKILLNQKIAEREMFQFLLSRTRDPKEKLKLKMNQEFGS